MEEEAKYERIGRLVYGFHRWAKPERLRDPQTLPPAFAKRGAELADRFDAALASFQAGEGGGASDHEIAAILAQAQAFALDLHAADEE